MNGHPVSELELNGGMPIREKFFVWIVRNQKDEITENECRGLVSFFVPKQRQSRQKRPTKEGRLLRMRFAQFHFDSMPMLAHETPYPAWLVHHDLQCHRQSIHSVVCNYDDCMKDPNDRDFVKFESSLIFSCVQTSLDRECGPWIEPKLQDRLQKDMQTMCPIVWKFLTTF
jgi:hypothetical protein